jgi:hypothetical protein
MANQKPIDASKKYAKQQKRNADASTPTGRERRAKERADATAAKAIRQKQDKIERTKGRTDQT